jgi:hypothetical protein
MQSGAWVDIVVEMTDPDLFLKSEYRASRSMPDPELVKDILQAGTRCRGSGGTKIGKHRHRQ